jgi:oligo-1,6-glucosidase
MSMKTDAVIYQVYPRSFKDSDGDGIGDLEGIIEKIPHIRDLGANWIWLSPVYASPMADNGYDISDYKDIHPDFGDLGTFDRLVSACHENGIRLMMDLVFNHTSDKHPWFEESRRSKDNPKRDFYIWREGKGHRPPNNWTSFFTGPAWTYDKTTGMWYLHMFAKEQPDLNWENPEVREALKDVVRFWNARGVDGYRLDVINLISKTDGLPDGKRRLAVTGQEHVVNGPRVHDHVRELSKAVFIPEGKLTVGETVFITPEEALKFVSEDREELDMVFHFEHMGVDNFAKWFIRPFKPHKLRNVLAKWQTALSDKGWNALYFENHDQPRSVSRFGDDTTYHDKSAKMLAALLVLERGTPYIYQGQEIGMTNVRFDNLEDYRDVESLNVYRIGREKLHLSHKRMMKKLKYMGRDNARTPMQWDDSLHAGFTEGTPWIKVNPNKDRINVKRQSEDNDSVLSFYTKLIALRRKTPVFSEGTTKTHKTGKKTDVIFERRLGGELWLVVANHSKKTRTVTLPKEFGHTPLELVLSNHTHSVKTPVDIYKPYEVRIYRKL